MADTVKLTKGENINLSKQAPGLEQVVVGLGWDVNEGISADLDAMCFLLTADGKVRSNKDFVYYGMDKTGGKLVTADGAVEHTGDNLTGEGEGDDEQIKVNLSKVPADVERILFLVDIYEAAQKSQNFGQVKNAFVRLVNGSDNTEVVRYDLSEDYSGKTDVTVAELYRKDGEWKFKAVGEGDTKGAQGHAQALGVNA